MGRMNNANRSRNPVCGHEPRQGRMDDACRAGPVILHVVAELPRQRSNSVSAGHHCDTFNTRSSHAK